MCTFTSWGGLLVLSLLRGRTGIGMWDPRAQMRTKRAPPHPHPQTEPGTWGACHIRVVNSLTVTGCCPPFSQPLPWPISSRWERIRVGGLVMGSDRRTDVDPAAPSSIKRAHGACSRMERGGMAGVVPATLGCPCCGGWAGRGQGTGQPCLPLSPPLSLSLQPCGHQGAVW